MGTNRRKVKEKTGWRKDQKDKHLQKVEQRIEHIKRIKFIDIDENIIKENQRAAKMFSRRWEI